MVHCFGDIIYTVKRYRSTLNTAFSLNFSYFYIYGIALTFIRGQAIFCVYSMQHPINYKHRKRDIKDSSSEDSGFISDHIIMNNAMVSEKT